MGDRTYGDSCGIARALDVLGDRWTLLVLRELLLGPKRFSDLASGLGRLSPDVLTQRLRELESAGLVSRSTLTGPGRARVYQLTDRGTAVRPVLLALGRFGSEVPLPARPPSLGPDATAVALLTTFDPRRAGTLRATYRLELGDEVFRVDVADGEVVVDRAEGTAGNATITTTPGPLAAVLWHGRPLQSAIRDGDIAVAGNQRVASRFFRLFPLA